MSTNIAIIKGRQEFPDTNTKTVNYKVAELYITRFSGGSNGPMLQLSTGLHNDAHIQLTQAQVAELRMILNNWENAPENN